MKKYRIHLLSGLLFFILTLGFLYSFFLFILPKIVNNGFMLKKVNSYLSQKAHLNIIANNLNLKTYPNLCIDLVTDKIEFSEDNKELLTAKQLNLSYDVKKLSLKNLTVDYIFINEQGFKSFLAKNTNKKPSQFKFKKFPQINIKQAEIWVENGGLNNIFITVSDFNIINSKDNKTYFTFEIEIISDLLRNLINIGKNGCLYIDNNSLYAKDLQVLIGVSNLDINGKIIDDDKNIDFTLNGNDIPVQDIEASLLYFQKVKSKGKKFLENFYDFSGEMDVDLNINNKGAFGKCVAKNLSAITVLFDVPVLFKNYVFNFNGRNIQAADFGLLGGGKVYNELKLSNIALPEFEVSGYVSSKISDKVAEKYIPNVSIKGYADTSVKYNVKNHKIFVDYLLKLKKGSELYYKNAYLGLEDKNRRLFVNTLKEADKLSITHYDYSIQNGNVISNIILGNGLLEKHNGHLEPSYITCKTNGYAPISVTGSFGRYINGGEFKGDLKYDFNKYLLTGNFNIQNSQYKDFYVDEAFVNADSKNFNVQAKGSYMNSPFKCKFSAENNFSSKININEMYLFLDKFVFKKSSSPSVSISSEKSKQLINQAKELNITIKKWTIIVNKIKHKRIELTDILLTGELKDDIFCFIMPHVHFAKGILSANGLYNFKDSSSSIIFKAKNIDSNVVADVVFDLPNQIEGIANATLCAETKNGFDDIKAYASFSVEKGFLPMIGNINFLAKKSILNRSLAFKLSDMIHIDVKNLRDLSSNIQGSFSFDNSNIKDVKITSSQKYLAMLIEGNYNLETQKCDMQLLGKYNNNQINRVKVFYIPLSWLVRFVFKPENTLSLYSEKLKQIPSIIASTDETTAFRVKMNGNLNRKNLNIEMKRLK